VNSTDGAHCGSP